MSDYFTVVFSVTPCVSYFFQFVSHYFTVVCDALCWLFYTLPFLLQPMVRAKESPQCAVCEFVMKEVEGMLEDETTEVGLCP